MVKIKKNEFGGFFSNSIIQIVLILWAIFQLFPIIWLFYSSFKPSIEIKTKIFNFPNTFYFKNYDFSLFSDRGITLGIYFKNSVIVTVIALIILTVVSVLAGYAMGKVKFPGKNIIILILIGIIGIPLYSLIIPLYYFIAKIGLLNNYFGLILPYVAFNIPFSVVMLQAYFREFPNELIEAARIDGCNVMTAFLKVVMPLSLGAISSVLIINFISIWNEFLFALVIMRNNDVKTLPVGMIAFKGQYVTDWGPMLSALVVAILPTLVFYLIFHRNIIKGISSGAIKE